MGVASKKNNEDLKLIKFSWDVETFVFRLQQVIKDIDAWI